LFLHYGLLQSLGVERATRQIGIDAGHGIVVGKVGLAGQLFEEMRSFQAVISS